MKYQFDVKLQIFFEPTQDEFNLITEAIEFNPELTNQTQEGGFWFDCAKDYNHYISCVNSKFKYSNLPAQNFITISVNKLTPIMNSLELYYSRLINSNIDKAKNCNKLFVKFITLLKLANDRYAEISKTSKVKEI